MHDINLAIEAPFKHSIKKHFDLGKEGVLVAHDDDTFQAANFFGSNEGRERLTGMFSLARGLALGSDPIRCGHGNKSATRECSVQGQVDRESGSLGETCYYHLVRVNAVFVPNLLIGPGDVMF